MEKFRLRVPVRYATPPLTPLKWTRRYVPICCCIPLRTSPMEQHSCSASTSQAGAIKGPARCTGPCFGPVRRRRKASEPVRQLGGYALSSIVYRPKTEFFSFGPVYDG